MTIASTPPPLTFPTVHGHRSAVTPERLATQAFTVGQQTSIGQITVAGHPETSFRVTVWTKDAQDKADKLIHARINIAPTTTAEVHVLDFMPFIIPPGDYLLSVQGETLDWAWYGGAQYADEKAFSIDDQPATPDAGLRFYRAGSDAFNWAIGQMGTPGSEAHRPVIIDDVDVESAAIIAELDAQWGGGFPGIGMGKKQTQNEDFVTSIIEVDNATPVYEWMPRTRFLEELLTGAITLPEDFHLDPHGDRILVRWPANGRLDGVGGVAVIQNENGVEPVLSPDGDAHGYTINADTGVIQETYKMDGAGLTPPGFGAGEFAAGVTRLYDLKEEIASYPGDDCCTSANARGGYYMPFLFESDDIKAANGEALPHALPVTMNNDFTRADEYWGNATHTPLRSPQHTASANGMPYGCHFRLKQSFVIDPSWPPALRTICETLKIYGMVHVDGSNPGQLVATNDRYNNVSWDDPAVQMNPNDLAGIAGLSFTDFDVVTPIRGEKKNIQTCNCRRTPALPEFQTW